MTAPLLLSIQTGLPRLIEASPGDFGGERPWKTAFFKSPVSGPVPARRSGLQGDAQADLRVHGGLDKALLAYSADHFPFWREELGEPTLGPGGCGENLTITGLDEQTVCLGDIFQIGSVHLQASQPRQPCWKLARRWQRKDLPVRVVETGCSGWYFRVLQEGSLEQGMPVLLLDRGWPKWSLAWISRLLHEGDQPRLLREVAGCPVLASSWRRQLLERAARLEGRD